MYESKSPSFFHLMQNEFYTPNFKTSFTIISLAKIFFARKIVAFPYYETSAERPTESQTININSAIIMGIFKVDNNVGSIIDFKVIS